MKTEIINNKAYVSLTPNTPGALFHVLDNLKGNTRFTEEAAKVDNGTEVVLIQTSYRRVAEGLWYIKSRYAFNMDTELMIGPDNGEPYFEMEYFFTERGSLSLDDHNSVSLKDKMLFSNSGKSLVWHIGKGTKGTSYKFLFTRKFLCENFFTADPRLANSAPGQVFDFSTAYCVRRTQEKEVALLNELNNLREQDAENFLYTVAIKSCSMQLLQIFFEEQLIKEAPGGKQRADGFAKVTALLHDSIYKEFPGMDRLAGEANMSVSTFKRKFGERFDTSPELYFRTLQMNEAERLLKMPGSSIKEIAHKFGFANTQNFRTAFKKIKGYGADD